MISCITRALRLSAVASAFIFGLVASDKTTIDQSSFVTQAHAIIGRPLTPMSYAGVARRTTARAVTAGAVTAGAVAAGAVVAAGAAAGAAAACVQVADAYGRVYMSCP